MTDQTPEDPQAKYLRQVKQYMTVKPVYESLAARLKKILKKVADQVAPGAFIMGREKTIGSFAEKVLRKAGKYDAPVRQITDLAGARVVTHTSAEAAAVCRFLEKMEKDGPGFEIDWDNSLDAGTRLGPSEFGYQAVHYVVRLRGPEILGVQIEAGLRNLRGEIQVCTLLQHAWSAIHHDRIYKGQLKIPPALNRQLSRVAAFLEEGDSLFGTAVETLDTYIRDFVPVKTGEERKAEVNKWEAILAADEHDVRANHELGRLYLAAGEWKQAVKYLKRLGALGRSTMLCDLGTAVWREGDADRGREHLQRALDINPANVRALCEMGLSHLDEKPDKAQLWFEKAMDKSPDEPTALSRYLECRIRVEGSDRALQVMRHSMGHAIEECIRRAGLGVDLPEAHWERGRLELYALDLSTWPEHPYRSLHGYVKAIAASRHSDIAAEFGAVRRMQQALAPGRMQAAVAAMPELVGLEWARRLLVLGLAAARCPNRSRAEAPNGPAPWTKQERALLEAMATPASQRPRFRLPVVIVAGGCDARVEKDLRERYEDLLKQAFADFDGTIISGGTRAGISGIVGDLTGITPDAILKVAYLPEKRHMPRGDRVHPAYQVICRTPPPPRVANAPSYTPLGPMQTWADLLLSGIDPAKVRILGVNGGNLSAFEYRLGLGLGAKVGIVEESGRAASDLLPDADWQQDGGLAPLPSDWATLSAFVKSAHPGLDWLKRSQLEDLAKTFHAVYQESALNSGKVSDSAANWDALKEELRESNRQQAAHLLFILRAAGFGVGPSSEPAAALPPLPSGFAGRREAMAMREHGRFVAERLVAGWRYGEKKDIEKHLNPTLVAWTKLNDAEKAKDFAAIDEFPRLLQSVGLEIVASPCRPACEPRRRRATPAASRQPRR